MKTYWYAGRLVAIHQFALVDKGRLSGALIELGLAVPLLVHLDIGLRDTFCIAVAALLRLLELVFDTASNVLEVWRVSWLDHVIGSQYRAFGDQTQLFTKLKVGRVGRLVMIQKHEIDVLQLPRLVQTSNGFVTGANDDLDDVGETCQVDKRHDDGSKRRIALQAEVPLPSSFAYCITEEDARIANVAAEFDLGLFVSSQLKLQQLTYHCLGLDLCNKICHYTTLVLSNIHEVLLRATILINGCENILGRAPDLLNIGVRVNKVQKLDLTTVVEEGTVLLLRCVRFALIEAAHDGCLC